MTLATSTRYKKYEPVVSTTDFLVTFPIFSTDDIEVRVDDIVVDTFTISATFDDGRSDDASVTLATAVNTPQIVELYGRRAPRRDNNYLPGDPELATNLQRDIEAVTAVQQEQQRDFNRSLQMPVEDGAVYEVFEKKAARANKVMAFDSAGDPFAGAPASGALVSTYMAGIVAAASEAALYALMNLGTSAALDATAFATAAQGTTADNALQDSDIGSGSDLALDGAKLAVRSDVAAAIAAAAVIGPNDVGSVLAATYSGGDLAYQALVTGATLTPTTFVRGANESNTAGLAVPTTSAGSLTGTWQVLAYYDSTFQSGIALVGAAIFRKVAS